VWGSEDCKDSRDGLCLVVARGSKLVMFDVVDLGLLFHPESDLQRPE
jgi:hypothetical protein